MRCYSLLPLSMVHGTSFAPQACIGSDTHGTVKFPSLAGSQVEGSKHNEALALSRREHRGERFLSVYWLAGHEPCRSVEPDHPREFLVADPRRAGLFFGGVGPHLALALSVAPAQRSAASQAISNRGYRLYGQ